MGVYLNDPGAYGLFQEDYSLTYYVDKTEILNELIPLLERKGNIGENDGVCKEKGPKYVAITRPRRFGKTVMANMITAFFEKGVDSHREFDTLKISRYPWYKRHLNQHNVIHIVFNETPRDCTGYTAYIDRIQNQLLDDLIMEYPHARIRETDAVWDALKKVYTYCKEEKFIFVLDEWDYIYHQDFVTEKEKESFTKFLSNLLKDKAYVEMAYMTGILPIAKYSSGSELNMFFEYSMASRVKYSEYFGFSEEEVDELYEKYLTIKKEPHVTREGLRLWYDGYKTADRRRLYNPRSVVGALSDDQLGSYWTSSGPYDEIFSAMVVYGFLNYENGYVSIPNKELMDKFAEVVQREPSMGNVYKLTKESGRMLMATKAGDTKTMTELMEYAHNTHSPMRVYSDEAIQQIKDRQYALRFEGKFGENPEYTGRILAVGIAYHKSDESKRHECKVEVLRDRV